MVIIGSYIYCNNLTTYSLLNFFLSFLYINVTIILIIIILNIIGIINVSSSSSISIIHMNDKKQCRCYH